MLVTCTIIRKKDILQTGELTDLDENRTYIYDKI